MFPSSIARAGLTGVRSSTKPWLRAYEFRVIMFMPQASPVVYAYMTWHIGPTTWVSSSRSFACLERLATGSEASQAFISSSCPSIHREKASACAASAKGRRTRV